MTPEVFEEIRAAWRRDLPEVIAGNDPMTINGCAAGPRHDSMLIIDAVCRVFETTPETIFSTSRLKSVVQPRHLAMTLLNEAGWPLTEIGQRFGQDHTTVLHAVRTYPRRVDQSPMFRERAERVRKDLGL